MAGPPGGRFVFGRPATYRNEVPPVPGLVGHSELIVSQDDTAIACRSGDVAVLSTPRIAALCEEAAVNAIVDRLGDDETSVGMRIQLDHLTPSAIGSSITADAKLEKVEGHRLVFSVSVNDDRGLVAAGKILRVIVDRETFLDKCR